jgi:GT2 family glycosyltransferase
MKTLIAVPTMDMCHARFAQSLAMLDKVGECQVSFIMNSLIYDARNKFCQQAIEGEFDYILWLDSDMVFPSYVLQQFMQDDQDIVAGLYFRRNYPFTPVAFSELRRENGVLQMKDLEEWPNKMFEVDGVGFGCVLMKTDCLFDIAGKEGGVWFTPTPDAGEDAAFCLRAKSYGYEIWIDPAIKLGHVGQAVITEGVHRSRRKEKP